MDWYFLAGCVGVMLPFMVMVGIAVAMLLHRPYGYGPECHAKSVVLRESEITSGSTTCPHTIKDIK